MKQCPFCGHDDARLCETTAGVDNVPSWHYKCFTCGVNTLPVTLYIDAPTEAKAKDKALKRWELRARIARNEKLVDNVDKIRSLLGSVASGCMARTKAASHARACLKEANKLVEQILPLAKNADIKQRQEGRFLAYEDLEG